MTGEIVELPKKEAPRVWECSCGCQIMHVFEDGQVQCSDCDRMQNGYNAIILPLSTTSAP